ncbi:hypothetical protein LN650_00430 [Klebsiella pneumoniae subsp. pneumoniae]|nr:hypothetical protein [Klebsiella pneumoniae subsp. pneumoniae]
MEVSFFLIDEKPFPSLTKAVASAAKTAGSTQHILLLDGVSYRTAVRLAPASVFCGIWCRAMKEALR